MMINNQTLERWQAHQRCALEFRAQEEALFPSIPEGKSDMERLRAQADADLGPVMTFNVAVAS